ncbi:hypothetical protein VNI00_018430 [Paramarasmius palmivorus]|uniref:XPG-I domain-containing protein n=1 Tax=Paramarasmius palmivorus TaxID=297713 RepID=A0AAW0AY53_9AGAR
MGRNGRSYKRGKKVTPEPHWMIDELRHIADIFHFPVHQAPGDAEAELAALARRGIIDVVLTDDSDAWF